MTPAVPGAAVVARVDALCRALEEVVEPDAVPEVAACRSRLAEPLRLAVVGRVSTGKSTLVNALVGRRVAPTSAGECTRVVTWYRFGAPDRAVVHLRDGGSRTMALSARGLPEDLGVPAEDVARLDVFLASGPLRSLTLVDTPGLDSLTEANVAATRRAVLGASAESQRAAGQADAVLYLIADAARRSDLELLADFHASSGPLATTALNAVGVLARADTVGGGPLDDRDALQVAGGIAAGLAEAHRAELSDVVAVSGLLAETARTGRISEDLARRMGSLHAEDELSLALRLQDPDLADLVRDFGPYGLVEGRGHAVRGAQALKHWCEQVSGITHLESVVSSGLLAHSAVLKAARAVESAQAVASAVTDGGRRSQALTLVETARLSPDLHPLEELRALQALRRCDPGSPVVAQLEAFLASTADSRLAPEGANLVEAARRRSGEATRTAALAVSPAEADAARVLARSYHLLARRLAAPATEVRP